MDLNGQFDEDVLVAEIGLLQAAQYVSIVREVGLDRTYVSVVNLPSRYAAMKLGLNRYACMLRLP